MSLAKEIQYDKLNPMALIVTLFLPLSMGRYRASLELSTSSCIGTSEEDGYT